jgi:hypothetical protein
VSGCVSGCLVVSSDGNGNGNVDDAGFGEELPWVCDIISEYPAGYGCFFQIRIEMILPSSGIVLSEDGRSKETA